ncbi:MAG TPA: hypothetical protein V6C86_17200 [Oculatellaceae cyanobacterium]
MNFTTTNIFALTFIIALLALNAEAIPTLRQLDANTSHSRLAQVGSHIGACASRSDMAL